MDAASNVSPHRLAAPNASRAWSLPRAVVVATGLLPLAAFLAFLGLGFFAIPPVAIFVTLLTLLALANVAYGNRWTLLAAGIVGALFVVGDLGPGGDPYAFRPDLGWMHFVSVVVVVCGILGLLAGIAGFVGARRGAPSANVARWGVLVVGLALGLVGATAWSEALVVAHPAASQASVVENAPDATLALTLQGDAFAPAALGVSAGQLVKLTLTNRDVSPHNFHVDGLPTVAEIPAGGSVVVWLKIDKPGDYGFFCSLHPGMKGTLHVA